jgi:hypothetical protein
MPAAIVALEPGAGLEAGVMPDVPNFARAQFKPI